MFTETSLKHLLCVQGQCWALGPPTSHCSQQGREGEVGRTLPTHSLRVRGGHPDGLGEGHSFQWRLSMPQMRVTLSGPWENPLLLSVAFHIGTWGSFRHGPGTSAGAARAGPAGSAMAGGRHAQTALGPPCLLLTWPNLVGVRCELVKDFPAPRATISSWEGRLAEGQPTRWADTGPVTGTCSRCLLGRGSPRPSGRSPLPASLVRRTPLSAPQSTLVAPFPRDD